ncbi:hypothetical protein F5Y10DRAFT_242682 [Nemania abortiva]|nr:hypothetical protein F5Y10DRAFT_242682 [Nemania abortiva]
MLYAVPLTTYTYNSFPFFFLFSFPLLLALPFRFRIHLYTQRRDMKLTKYLISLTLILHLQLVLQRFVIRCRMTPRSLDPRPRVIQQPVPAELKACSLVRLY